MNQYLLGLAGIAAIILIAVAFSSNRRAINLRVVGAAFTLQAALAFLVIKTPWGRAVIQAMSDGVAELLGYATKGTEFLFGPSTSNPLANVVLSVVLVPPLIYLFVGFGRRLDAAN